MKSALADTCTKVRRTLHLVWKVIYYTRCTTGAAHNKGGQKGEGADMARKWSIWLGAALVAVLAGLGVIGASAAPPATADPTAVMQWNIIAISTIVGIPGPGLPGPAGGAPRHLKSTWEWSRGPSTTRSTRSRRSTFGRTS